MGPTLSPETSAFKLQTPGKFPEEYKLHSEHGESLKTTVHHNVIHSFQQRLFVPQIMSKCLDMFRLQCIVHTYV